MKVLTAITLSLIAISANAQEVITQEEVAARLGKRTFAEAVDSPCMMLPEFCVNVRENFEHGYKLYRFNGELADVVIVPPAKQDNESKE